MTTTEPLNQRVLVVDDDATVRLLYSAVLEKCGYDVIAAEDGEGALRHFTSQPVDLVLLDSCMPGCSGIEVLAKLRALSSVVPVAFVTGLDDTDDRIHGLDSGADDYITKPVAPGELVARVHALLRGRKAAIESVTGATESMDHVRVEIEETLRAGRFGPVFQPIVRLRDRRVVAYEALTRFEDGTRPDVRFAQAHAVGLGERLELATLASAIDMAAELPQHSALHLNVGPDLIAEPLLAQLLTTSDREIVVELTEHDPVSDYERLRDDLGRLGKGVRLAIDDAGAGYASMTHVLALDPDEVKLDRSWVSGVDSDIARQALIAGLVTFAATTGSALIAEGIENAAEADTLVELGVEFGQGYHLGRPVPVDRFVR